jgi:hypothetical protein
MTHIHYTIGCNCGYCRDCRREYPIWTRHLNMLGPGYGQRLPVPSLAPLLRKRRWPAPPKPPPQPELLLEESA